MKILLSVTYVSLDGAFGGPVSVAVAQAKALALDGHSVTLLAGWDGQADLVIPGVSVVLLRSYRVSRHGFVATWTPRLRSWLRKHLTAFEIVHVHSGRHLFDVTIARQTRRAARPYVLQPHGMITPTQRHAVRALDRLATIPMLRAASTVLVLTDAEQSALESFGLATVLTRVRNGVDIAPLPHHKNDSEVLFLARLHPRKRVLAFAEMAAIVHTTSPKTRFTVVGPDEGDLAALRDFMRAHPSVPISYEGPISSQDAPARIARAAVYVLPSRGEVFPMTVLEALSVGTATVLTNDCGIAAELEARQAARVSNGTPSDLAANVTALLTSTEARDSLVTAGRRAAENDFSMNAVVKVLESRYESASQRPSVLWMTNAAAPYRIPVWRQLAHHVSLEVSLLETDARLQRDSNNRGLDWQSSRHVADAPFTISFLRTAVLRRGEHRYYLGVIRMRQLRGRQGIVFGGWESPVYWFALLQAKRAGLRTVGFYESHAGTQGFRRGLVASVRRRFFTALDAVVTPGKAATAALLKMGVDPNRIHEGFNAVDVSAIRELILESSTPTPEAGSLRIIYVGQLIERKNVATLVSAVATIPSAHLTITGVGPLREDLEKQISETFDDPSRVHFTGYVSGEDVPSLMREHGVLVLPSHSEVWGLVVNEALACGLHVVVSSRAGVTASVGSHEGVIICEPTFDGIKDALMKVPVPTRRIRSPKIWHETPEAFAEVFRVALTGQR